MFARQNLFLGRDIYSQVTEPACMMQVRYCCHRQTVTMISAEASCPGDNEPTEQGSTWPQLCFYLEISGSILRHETGALQPRQTNTWTVYENSTHRKKHTNWQTGTSYRYKHTNWQGVTSYRHKHTNWQGVTSYRYKHTNWHSVTSYRYKHINWHSVTSYRYKHTNWQCDFIPKQAYQPLKQAWRFGVTSNKKGFPSNWPWRPIRFWDLKYPTLSRQSAHSWQQVCQPYAPAALCSTETLFLCFWY
jgi:hypothetical protein